MQVYLTTLVFIRHLDISAGKTGKEGMQSKGKFTLDWNRKAEIRGSRELCNERDFYHFCNKRDFHHFCNECDFHHFCNRRDFHHFCANPFPLQALLEDQ